MAAAYSSVPAGQKENHIHNRVLLSISIVFLVCVSVSSLMEPRRFSVYRDLFSNNIRLPVPVPVPDPDPDPESGNGGQEELLKSSTCDIYKGRWVKDEKYRHPIYYNTAGSGSGSGSGSCPYVDEGFDCQSNGRPDSEYFKWRWNPFGCHLPRFNATDFLVRIKGKKLMMVGDSLTRNQFESLLCLLRAALQNTSKLYELNGCSITKGRRFLTFKFEDYDCTVDYVRSHFLVKKGVSSKGQGKGKPNSTLSLDIIHESSDRWKQADILVFNTGHWWTYGKTAMGKNYYKEGDYIYPQLDSMEAYRKALKTWGKWIDQNISPATLVFYRGYSSDHFRGGDWDTGGTCVAEKEPFEKGNIIDTYPLKMRIVEEVIQQMQVPVVILNVTTLTMFRKDGHPSVYGKKVVDHGRNVSKVREDCSHWCLPGIPDAWNEVFYAALVAKQTSLAT